MPTTISGTTGVNLIQDGTIVAADFASSTGSGSVVLNASPSFTGTLGGSGIVAQTNLATNVAGTGPAFSAYRGSNQSFSYTSWTKIALNGEDFDTNNNFDPTTNYRFTPTVAGYYQFNGVASLQSSTSLTRTIVALWKNNAQVLRGSDLPISAGTQVVFANVQGIFYMNGSTDFMELYVYAQGTGTVSIVANGGEYTTLSGCLVRAA